MSKGTVHPDNPEGGERTDVPLLTLSQRNFAATSTGSMELVGVREHKTDKVSDFESMYRQPEEKSTAAEIVKGFARKQVSKFSLKKTVVRNFPILKAFQKYKVTQDLPNDVIAGLTSGIMMIPQGMAFASLATLDPIVGLYISLFASITYFLLGTGQQLSWGCIAILSIMMGSILDKYDEKVLASLGVGSCGTSAVATTLSPVPGNSTSSVDDSSIATLVNTTLSSVITISAEMPEALTKEKRLEVAGAVTLICGIILAVLGKVGFGKVTVFMSDSLITGFTVGAAFHVGSSQLKTIFGLSSLPRYSGIFKLIKLWVAILANIDHSNLATIIASVICILIIYLVKRFVNEKYKKKLRVPVPIELIVVIIATVIMAFTDLSDDFSIGIVKDIPVGVPAPRFPDLSLGADYVAEGMMIIIVAFAQTVAMAKLMGLKHNYKVDPNQEMFACGVVSIICSIFSGYISGASVSRSVVQDSAGGRTQIASLFAAGLVLLVIMLIGPYFYYLPKCVLSAIIVVSLRSMFLKLLTIPDIWRKSKVDCLVWVITCASVVILDADIGLLVGIVASVLIVLIRSQVASVDVTGQISAGRFHVWRSTDKYYGAEEVADTKVVRINSALYFANAEIVTNRIFKVSGVNPIIMKKKGVVDLDREEIVKAEDKGGPVVVADNVPIESDEMKVNSEEDGINSSAMDSEKHGQDRKDLLNDGAAQLNGVANPCTVESTTLKMTVPFSNLVLDLSGASFIDLMGVSALEFLISKYQSVGISVYIANVHEKCLHTLEKSGFMKKHGDRVFITTETAIAQAPNVTQN
ncbi:hypothetical protein BaRGS_00026743 [Batillaria attramentaria]|uniref:STAS domain-containing protein n=1 Tax=Batillaria attramentaria TaxID=370345 RepID=A0ABD0K553_9CAEN